MKLTQKIPSIKGHWLLGSTPDFARSTLGFVEECMQNYQDIVHSKIAFRDFYVLLNPELIDHVLRKNQRNYKKSFAYKSLKTFLGDGLLTSEGEHWKGQRKLIQPAFHKKKLQNLAQLMAKATEEMLDRWDEKQQLDIRHEMLLLTGKIVTHALFGNGKAVPSSEKIAGILAILRQYANDKMKNPFKLPLFVPTQANQQFKQARHDLKALVLEIIQTRRENASEHEDLLGSLMEVRDEETGKALSDEELYEQIVTLFIAGQETTANALSFLFFLVSQHPQVSQKLKHELSTVARQELVSSLQELDYTRQVVQESLRFYPPAWAISREALSDDVLGGYLIPQGATIFLSIYAMHRHPDFWECPDTFSPERFENEYPKNAYMPFGLGARMCIGNHFALMEMQLISALVLKRFDLQLKSSPTLQLITPMTLCPKEAIIFQATTSQ